MIAFLLGTGYNHDMLIAIFLLAAVVLFYFAYKAKPAPNKTGTTIMPPKQWNAEKDSLVIGTYNVQSGKDINGKRDISRSAELIKNADIVGIQEVYAATWFGEKSQAEQLAAFSDFGWLFAATRRRWFREHRGNALLSRKKIHDWSITMLPDETGKQFRNLITAKTTLKGKEIAILVTHLHTKKGREVQLKFVLDEFQKHQYAILLGDFNTPHTSTMLQALIEKEEYQDAILQTCPSHQDKNRIDWIICKGLVASDGFFEPIGVSDHPYYQVTLSF